MLQVCVSNISAISNICCKCFIWMLHNYSDYSCILQVCFPNILAVSSRCCMFSSGCAYVAVAIHVRCKCIFQMFHMFHTYVASVLSGCCICYSGYTHMLQTYISIISPCFSMLQQVLLSARSNSRAHTQCMHPSSDAYLYHTGQLQ
jgi:hypothetical protein